VSRRTLRLALVGYAVKSVLLALLFLLAPELPDKALGHARAAWARLTEDPRR
jgi:hypothetical protein